MVEEGWSKGGVEWWKRDGVMGVWSDGWRCGVVEEGWSDGGVEWWKRDGVRGVGSGGRGME